MFKEGKGIGVFLNPTTGKMLDEIIKLEGTKYRSRAHCIQVIAERELERVRKLKALEK